MWKVYLVTGARAGLQGWGGYWEMIWKLLVAGLTVELTDFLHYLSVGARFKTRTPEPKLPGLKSS